ncbi:VanZ family protein [Vogesella indigofera]|uniref:VanZ family protein n=1 Tax=Vogesella indigofera TaxID=45465 RepID=UPI00234EED3B|nr:VanZ family protein [Vogesella indigofera]MDC7711844.1 VanZ family protein [Vogesella indigofera]
MLSLSLRRSLAAAGWWLFSVYLLLLKPAGTPSAIPHFDKLGHALLFAVWAWLLARSFATRQRSSLRPTLWLCLGWALLSELAQGSLTLTRSAEAGDVVADMAGALIGLYLWRRGKGR